MVEDSLYGAYNTTFEDYLKLARTHDKQIRAYLAAHPETSEEIQNLKTSIENLIEQYEALLVEHNIRGSE